MLPSSITNLINLDQGGGGKGYPKTKQNHKEVKTQSNNPNEKHNFFYAGRFSQWPGVYGGIMSKGNKPVYKTEHKERQKEQNMSQSLLNFSDCTFLYGKCLIVA